MSFSEKSEHLELFIFWINSNKFIIIINSKKIAI